jgi:hypothetical protein
MRTSTTLRLWVLAVASVVIVVACDRVPLISPTGSTISLTADRTVLPLNGQTTVRAVVTESAGTPVHNGTMVTFNPSIGRTEPVEAPTVNGIATVTFLAGSVSGTGFIHAFSGGARTGSGNSSSGGVEVKIGAAAAGSIAVTATPSSVSQSGGTVTISALVLDSANNPLPGVSVLFTTSTGTLSATTALSDSSGIARTQLTTTQTATVNAIAGAAKGEVRVDVSTAPTAAIDVSPSPAIVGSPVAITVTPGGVGTGNASPRQVSSLTVDFGDGTAETRTNVTGPTAFTHVYGREGAVTITARVVDVSGNTGVASRALVINRSQPTVTLTAPASIDYSDTNGVAGFTVVATAAAGQPPIQNVVVSLGDGTVIFSGSSGGSFTYQFPSTGTYAVNARATDSAGGTGTASAVVRVVP